MPDLGDLLDESAGVEPVQLYSFVHDANVLNVLMEDELGRCTVSLRSNFISHHHGLDIDTTYRLVVNDVHRLIALWQWSQFHRMADVSPPPHFETTNPEYYERRRQESVGWKTFEDAIRSDEHWEVSAGFLFSSPEATALQLYILNMNRMDSYQVAVCGSSIDFRLEDRPVTLDELLGMGRSYWAAWSRSVKKSQKDGLDD